MRVVLSTSPHVRHPAVLENDFAPDPSVMYSFAPVGLLSLAAVLRESMHLEPVLFDLNRNIVTGAIPLGPAFYRGAAERICAQEPDVLGLMTECDSYHHVLQILQEVKRQRPECACVLGGPHATAVAAETMATHDFVDAIVLGEGEQSFPDLLECLAAGDTRVPAGTLRRTREGVRQGGNRPLVAHLDELPIPAYDLYPGTREEEIFIEAGRGCPFQCTFCSTAPFWQRRHRVKSPARILEEIGVVRRLYASKRVHFTHDLLTTDKRWVVSLCECLIAAGVPVKWTCSARTDTVDRALLQLMASAGCNAVYFGLESGSQRILREIDKDIPVEHSLDTLRLCREVGIQPNAGFIVGFPTEDRTSLRETFDAYARALALGTKPDYIFGFCPFAASSLYPRLDTLACDGHFVDLPIDPEIDRDNRALIASNVRLYGSYFRPAVDVGPTPLQGIDEFSSLAEAVAVPVLELSRSLGGMLELFEHWSAWIERRNRAAGASPHRRFYGSPLNFCEFLVEELRAVRAADDPILQLAQVMQTTFLVAQRWSSAPPTSMAAYRALREPAVGPPLRLGDHLRLNAAVATMRLDWNLVPLLDKVPEEAPAPERTPTYLVWDLSEDGRVRLSEVDDVLFAALERLQEGPQPVATLMAESALDGAVDLDYGRWMHALDQARSMRIVETV